jgi:DNA-binding IclR family transcriptional regulator
MTAEKQASLGAVQSVGRACRILRAIVESDDPPSAADLAHSLGLNVSTVHHLLNTLVAEGMARKGPDRRYSLGPTIHYLASTVQWEVLARPDVMRELDELHRRTQETTYAGMWQGDEIVVGVVRPGVVPVVVGGLGVGQRQDSFGATAKALLAFSRADRVNRYLKNARRPPGFDRELAEVRERRYAVDVGRFAEGVACLAAPVTGPDGLAIGTLSVAVPSERFKAKQHALVEAVITASLRASVETPQSERGAA